MKKGIIILLIIAVISNMFGVIAFGAENTSVFKLRSLGIIDNYEEAHIVTRAEAVSSFVRMLLGDVFDMGQSVFSDVSSDHKYVNEINYAKSISLVNGTSDNYFSPDEPVMGMHLVKMALVTLGYGKTAEDAGGYEEGYLKTAAKKGLLTGYGLDENVTMAEFVVLLNKMLDTEVLESIYGSESEFTVSETLYEKILKRSDLVKITEGVVTAVETSTLNGYKELREGEISIGNITFRYSGADALNLLGRTVTAYYNDDEDSGWKIISNIMSKNKDKELVIEHSDVLNLTKSFCRYYKNNDMEFSVNIAPNASFIYNDKNYVPQNEIINLLTGDVRLIDNNGDNIYDVVFIDEYESFVVDRVSSINETVFFKNNVFFRGMPNFKFDFNDEEKKYVLRDDNGNEISFSDIEENDVVTLRSSMDNKINYVTVSGNIVKGVITSIFNDDEVEITIDGEVYGLYAPNSSELLAKYSVGHAATFFVNNKNEIVDGEIGMEGAYGFVIAAGGDGSLSSDVKIKMVVPNKSQKVVEMVGTEEVIYYDYSNDLKVYDLAENVEYNTADIYGNILSTKKVSAENINTNDLKSSIVNYKFDKNGKINNLVVVPIDYGWFKSTPRYNFNGKINSFGGITNRDAFLIGNSTNVIFIPDVENPAMDDYLVDVTVNDKTSQTALAVRIDDKTQVAECAIIMATMRSQDVKPFNERTKYSIVGKVWSEMINDEVVDVVEILTDKEVKKPFVTMSSNLQPIIKNLKCGDVVQYNTKSTGEIANIRRIAGMYEYKDIYSENIDNTVYGLVTDVRLNRLDNFLNEMVDDIILDIGGITKKYTAHREEGPVVYSYRRVNGEISIAETDEICQGDELFLLMQNNEIKAAVIFKNN